MELQIIRDLLNDLADNKINYCHWKSNQHINASLSGNTDLDVLFDERQKEEVMSILKKNNFHLFGAVWYKKYYNIVDYIGFDEKEAKVVHVHTHFKLDMGEVGVKSYRLPWEDFILENKIYDSDANIYMTSPIIEYVLLVIRTALKLDRINYKSNRIVEKDYRRESKWLHSKASIDEIKIASRLVLTEEITQLILDIRRSEEFDKKSFLSLKKQLKLFFKNDRILSAGRVVYLKYLHIFKRYKRKALIKLLGIETRQYRRTLPSKGIIVSLMGSDGAGKSTQSEEVFNELSKKVDVIFMYMGTGKGLKSFQRKLVNFLFAFGPYLGAREISEYINTNDSSFKNFLKQFVLSIKAASLAYERKSRLKRIEKERNRGGIVICDRYPQTSSLGMNDGMKLYNNIKCKNIILRSLAKYEFSCYNLANDISPNLVIKFKGDVKILNSRRPEMTEAQILEKQNGILDLKFSNETQVIIIDIDNSIKNIKGKILKAISGAIA